jgi:uncharacterized protein YfdQ (DUF2303 family)
MPDFRTHRCVLGLTKTEEYAAWDGADGKEMVQETFAQFIEDHMTDIAFPTGADMLELAKRIELTAGVQFTGKVELGSDARTLMYEEEVGARAGSLTIPEKFRLMIVPFYGMPAMELECRFRYVLRKPNVALSFKILRKKAFIVKMNQGAADMIAEGTQVPVFAGAMEN